MGTSGGFAPVAVSRLAGYDAREARVLPSASLLLGVSLDWRSGARSGLVTRAAVVTVRPGASDAPSSPSASPS